MSGLVSPQPAFSPIEPRLLIVLGMVAFLTGVTRTPITSFVLVLEMTDRRSALSPMMIAAMSAYAASHLVDHESFYERVRDLIVSAEPTDRERGGDRAAESRVRDPSN